MKQIMNHITARTFFNRYHHYLLTGICLLLIAASMAITGCDLTLGNDDEPEPAPAAISDELVPLPFFCASRKRK